MRSAPAQLPRRLAAVVAAAALLSALPSARALGDSAPVPSLDPVLSAMESLESSRDAKCHSTASRFEDFLYGTPLGDDARHANVEAQKRAVRRVWEAASDVAAESGEETVRAQHVDPALAALLVVERETNGALRVSFPAAPTVSLEPLRVAQYGSIAYSLRAILAVQQDALFAGGEPLRTLAPDAVDRLKDAVDTLSLCALKLADREAREANEAEIGGERMRATWSRLVPEDAPAVAREAAQPPQGTADARARSLALLDDLAARKTAAYRAYNELEERDTTRLLVANIGRFYARAPLPRLRRERREIVAALERHLDALAAALLRAGDARARASGHALIRAADAEAALAELVPHEIDEFEDVHVFPRLADPERVVLEAHDCDAFRDFGLHWRSLSRAAHAAPPEARLPDPFAAEVLAEGVSNGAVLLLRVAGAIAKRDTESVRLAVGDLDLAAEEIAARARRHHAAPSPPAIASRIVSAPGTPAGAPARAFFTEVTEAAGVAFVHRDSRWLGEFRQRVVDTPPTFSGGGVAAEDVDDDGDVDLLFVGGGGNALLLNDGAGRFEDATARAGIDLVRPDGSHGEPRSPVVADFDNDGIQDVLISYVDDDHRLFHGRGSGRFRDVSATSGLGGKGLVGGPVTVFDFDGDGLLDVYVGYFGDYLNGAIPTFDRDNRNGLPNRLYRNLGGLRFEDVARGSGSDDPGWTQAVSHVDFDRDGRQDLVVANDYGRNAFLRNLGGGRFENAAPALGITKAFHSMNVGVADLNDDDHPDVYVSNIATLVKDNKYSFPDVNTPLDFDLRAMAGMLVKESDMLYMSRVEQGRLAAYVPSSDVERGATSTGWAWDAEFLDFDHDGDDDLYLVNGTNDFHAFAMVYRRRLPEGRGPEYLIDWSRSSNVFFVNEGGRLANESARSGADFPGNSRSTAYLDYDGDGDLDIAVNNFNAPAKLFRNDVGHRSGGWLKLRLVGDPARGSNADAIGARVVVSTADGLRRHRVIQGGSGYLSMNPKEQHVGLGSAETADVRIVWPNGEEQLVRGLAANRSHTLRQGAASDETARALDVGQR
jgi:hypothetical protein